MKSLANVYNNPLYTAVAGLVAGIIIGLPVLGWWLTPVKYVDGDPAHLRADYKAEYIHMAVDSFALTNNAALAKERAEAVGDGLDSILKSLESSGTLEDAKNVARFRAAVGSVPPASGQASPAEPEPAQATRGYMSVLPYLCAGVVLLASAAGGFIYIRGMAGNRPRANAPAFGQTLRPVPETARAEPAAGAAGPIDPPIQQFMTIYQLGEDQYDDSFSIDSPSGSFLGECGVGISETIGVGDPKKVTAFEVWLFDKNDIRTVTKVLMSEHAYRDEALRSRLSAKGEPVVAAPGESVTMETASLRVTARVVDMAYGGGALPQNSFFERLTIELAAWQKPPVE